MNQELITFIQSRREHNVETKHHFTLKPLSSTSKSCLPFYLVSNATIKDGYDIIAAWTYHGEPLIQETIAIGGFINRKIVGFDDLVRLNAEYGELLDVYSHFPDTFPKSHVAVECVMCNMKILKQAIADVHDRVLDVIDSTEMNDAVSLLTNIFIS